MITSATTNPHSARIDAFLEQLRAELLAADNFSFQRTRPIIRIGQDVRGDVGYIVHGEGPVTVWSVFVTNTGDPDALPVVEPPRAA